MLRISRRTSINRRLLTALNSLVDIIPNKQAINHSPVINHNHSLVINHNRPSNHNHRSSIIITAFNQE
jgi:hypothetical protein